MAETLLTILETLISSSSLKFAFGIPAECVTVVRFGHVF
jgi:hypothetical protein